MSGGGFSYPYSADIGNAGEEAGGVGRTLGLDVGDKRIGVAVSDPEKVVIAEISSALGVTAQ